MHDPDLDDDPALLACIHAHLLRERIDASYHRFVLRHLRDRDDAWRYCCGSNCDPCAVRLAKVIDAVRAATGHGP